MTTGEVTRFVHTFENMCVHGDCDGWVANTEYFVQTDAEGEQTLNFKTVITGPHILAAEINKATMFVSNSVKNATKDLTTEIFGCGWRPNQVIGQCAVAESPYGIQEMFFNMDPSKFNDGSFYTERWTHEPRDAQKIEENSKTLMGTRKLKQPEENYTWKLGENRKMFVRFIHGIEDSGLGDHLKEGKTDLFDLILTDRVQEEDIPSLTSS